MVSLLLALLLGIPPAGDSLCPRFPQPGPVTYRTVDSLVAKVRGASFPELVGADIQLNELRGSGDYFSSGSELRTILNHGPRRAYLLYVNPKLFGDPPPREAIRAVVAHELSHLVDYEKRTALGLVGFTIHYLTRNPATYERATDLHALGRGYGCGLIAYREWLYRHVSARTAAAKRRNYLTPEEIRGWMLTGSLPSGAPPGPE